MGSYFWRGWIGSALCAAALLAVSAMAAEPGAAEPDTEPVSPVAEARARLAELRTLARGLEALETTARAANDSAQAACLRRRVDSLNGLIKIVAELATRMAVLDEEDDRDALEAAFVKVAEAVTRADQIVVEAAECAPTPPPEPKEAPPVRRKPAAAQVVTQPREVPPWLQKRRSPPRTAATCVRQGEMAWLWGRAIGLPAADLATPATCLAKLAELAIAPLNGWAPDECADVDVFAVVAARSLGLAPATESEIDPEECLRALRVFGLPVDSVLPERAPKAPAALLLKADLEQLLGQGLAAPLPNAQRVMPF